MSGNTAASNEDLDGSETDRQPAAGAGETPQTTAVKEHGPNLKLPEDDPKFAESFALVSRFADQGNALAQFLLADFYKRDRDNSTAIEKAVTLLRSAAEGGEPRAMFALGKSLLKGELGLKRSPERGFRFMEMAAKAGHGKAQTHVLQSLMTGNGAPQNVNKALKLYSTGFKKNRESHAVLGKIYQRGKGVEKDLCRAVEFFLRGVRQRDPQAAFQLYLIYANPKSQASGFYAPEKAQEVLDQAAAKGHPDAMFEKARAFASGWQTEPDPAGAAEWYEKAAEAGSAAAMLSLGKLYRRGADGVPPDAGKARAWLERAVAAGFDEAKAELAAL